MRLGQCKVEKDIRFQLQTYSMEGLINMWNHKKKTVAVLTLSLAIAGAGSASAASTFTDVKDKDNQTIVNALHDKGVVNGVTATQFKPDMSLTQPQALQILVKAFGLKDDASTTNDDLVRKAWYTDALRIAQANDLTLPDTFDPAQKVTREQFALWLHEAINVTGNYPTTKMFVVFTDQDKISKDASNAIQDLVNMNVIERSTVGQTFMPTKEITRMEAAEWLYNGVQMVERYKEEATDDTTTPTTPDETDGDQVNNPELSVAPATTGDEQTVTLTVQLPNPGYSVKITNVQLTDDKRAIVSYELEKPATGQMNPQVITEGKVTTTIPEGYTAELAK